MNLTLTEPPSLGRNEQADPTAAPGPVSLSEETTGRPPWRVVFGTLLLGLVAGLLGAEGAVLAELAKQEVWVGTGSIEVRDARIQSESVAVVLESPGLWHPIAEREGISDKEFQERYGVEVAGATQIVQVAFEDHDRSRARRIVDDILRTYVAQARAPDEVVQTETLQAHLASLNELEASIIESLDNSDDLPRLQQIDLQNELVRTRQQITTVIFRLDTRATDLAERRSIDPRIVTEAFILEEPVTPDPLKASVFGFVVGGLVALVAAYLVFHREAQAIDFGAFAAGGERSRRGLRLKRFTDIVVSASVLLVASPLILIVSVLIKATSRGPVFFRQQRVGHYDRVFDLYKFRTMTTDNDDSEHRSFVEGQLADDGRGSADDGRYKLLDNRVTGIGRPLRRFSIDELPQLWNVLKGDMSLVGPRPALPWETSLFEARFRERTQTMPGCTGLWQVSGRSHLSVRRMLELDIEYVKTRSLFKDLSILLKTPLVVLRGDGAR